MSFLTSPPNEESSRRAVTSSVRGYELPGQTGWHSTDPSMSFPSSEGL